MVQVSKNNINFNVSSVTQEGVGWWNNSYPTWEPNTFKVFDDLLTPNDVYIDLGTWSGPTILYAAQKVKQAYGIELDHVAYKACVDNVEANNYTNVQVDNIAISDIDGEVGVRQQSLGTSGCRIQENSSLKVKSLTMDSLMKFWNLDKCDFLKMDIEGAEEICLPTMESFFIKYNPLFYLSAHTHLGATSETIVNSTKSYKYVYDKTFTNIKDNLKEVIDKNSSSHGEQDYLFSNYKLVD